MSLPLVRLLGRGPLSIQAGLRIAAGVTAHLEAMHAEDRTYGSLSPSAVTIASDGSVNLGASDDQTQVRLCYQAPEQLQDAPVTARTDLYHLGLLLFELISGHRLYRGTGASARALILDAPPPDLAEERVDTPVEIVELVMELLCKAPDLRPASAAEVLERVTGAIEELVEWEGEELLVQLLPTPLTPTEVPSPKLSSPAETQRRDRPTDRWRVMGRDHVLATLLLMTSLLVGVALRVFS